MPGTALVRVSLHLGMISARRCFSSGRRSFVANLSRSCLIALRFVVASRLRDLWMLLSLRQRRHRRFDNGRYNRLLSFRFFNHRLGNMLCVDFRSMVGNHNFSVMRSCLLGLRLFRNKNFLMRLGRCYRWPALPPQRLFTVLVLRDGFTWQHHGVR